MRRRFSVATALALLAAWSKGTLPQSNVPTTGQLQFALYQTAISARERSEASQIGHRPEASRR